VHPYAVDTASGTESAPGHKDARKLRAFFEAVHGASVGEAKIGQPA
jgi:phosphoribosylanthranilate isomerase